MGRVSFEFLHSTILDNDWHFVNVARNKETFSCVSVSHSATSQRPSEKESRDYYFRVKEKMNLTQALEAGPSQLYFPPQTPGPLSSHPYFEKARISWFPWQPLAWVISPAVTSFPQSAGSSSHILIHSQGLCNSYSIREFQPQLNAGQTSPPLLLLQAFTNLGFTPFPPPKEHGCLR